MLDVLDLGGDSRSAKHLEKLAANPSDVVANTRFLGRVEVPLAETLTASTEGRWYTLMRRSTGDNVTGQVRHRGYAAAGKNTHLACCSTNIQGSTPAVKGWQLRLPHVAVPSSNGATIGESCGSAT